ncbi:SET and MYND domain-containing 4-like [Brachionus plicatilis]|uniref:Protein-lysine N-methyltransferase SMYD4 n=1 Tax=Brachionus plicatilis TaxID=10195 RepID=A0A3M7QP05_BRAPC|nr:SET and MYND domain-containing 4-like [Brachionus plicatilis]
MDAKSKTIDCLFAKICKHLKSHDKELNQNFIKLTTNFDRFKFIWHIGFIGKELDLLFNNTNFSPKDATKASAFRQEGNEQFKTKRFFDALVKYNSSLQFSSASQPENNLALAYANRSAVFYHLNEFQLCLNDIESALRAGYPQKSRPKLIERKLNCLLRLEQYSSGIEFIKAEKINLSSDVCQNFEKKFKTASADKKLTPLEQQFYFENYGHIDLTITSPNPKVACASKSIDIDYSMERGFFLRAAKDIQVGELLVNEPPFASVLMAHKIGHNCFECILKLNPLKMNVTYCRQCCLVAYCSEKCAAASWTHTHKYECKYLNFLINQSGLSHMEWLALRVVLKAGKSYLLSLKPLLEEYEQQFESSLRDGSCMAFAEGEDKVYSSHSYLPIFNLVTNSQVRKLNDLFRRSFVAFFLVKLLEKSDFFEADSAEGFKENQWFIGGLILRHLQSISCNAHEVAELHLSNAKKNAMAESSAQGIGAGIFAILSLFNHSCDPHVTRNFRGSRCQVRAVQNVKKGEEIYDNYGVLYAVNELKERRHKLKDQYFFECKCVPCRNDWPLYDKIESQLEMKNNLKTECIDNLAVS